MIRTIWNSPGIEPSPADHRYDSARLDNACIRTALRPPPTTMCHRCLPDPWRNWRSEVQWWIQDGWALLERGDIEEPFSTRLAAALRDGERLVHPFSTASIQGGHGLDWPIWAWSVIHHAARIQLYTYWVWTLVGLKPVDVDDPHCTPYYEWIEAPLLIRGLSIRDLYDTERNPWASGT